jgi:hypothetical protein
MLAAALGILKPHSRKLRNWPECHVEALIKVLGARMGVLWSRGGFTQKAVRRDSSVPNDMGVPRRSSP